MMKFKPTLNEWNYPIIYCKAANNSTKAPFWKRAIMYISHRQCSSIEHQTLLDETTHTNRVKRFEDIPGPQGMPFVGTLAQYRLGPFNASHFHEALLARYREYGDIFKETISGHTIVHIFNPEYIKCLYATEGTSPHIPPLLETTQMYRKERDMSPGLGNINGPEWYRLRTSVNKMMMRPKAVSMYLPNVDWVTEDFIQRMKQVRDPQTGEIPEFNNEINKWTLESSAMNCFEKRLGTFEADENSFQQQIINSIGTIMKMSLKLKFGIPWYKVMPQLSPAWRKHVDAEDFFFQNCQQFVDETVEKIIHLAKDGKQETDRYGFITNLLSKPDLTYKDVSIIALSLFADGLNSISPTVVGQLYCLANNPEAQEMLYDEISRLAPDPSQPVTSDILEKASFLKACIKEGFRFFPVGTEVSRLPQKDVVIGGYVIPAGTHVDMHNNLLLRLEEYFEDAESYQPERWLRGGSGRKIHPYLLLPFSFGPRACVGQRFAQQQMMILIFKVLQHFRLEWPHKERMGQVYNILLQPDMEGRIRFVPRQ